MAFSEGSEALSYRETAKALTGFIEVAIHTILRTRQIYPPELFVRRRKYDAPVYQSRHPALNEYIAGAVKAIGDEMLLGVLDKVIVVIRDRMDRPLERFMFLLSFAVSVEADEIDKPIQNGLTSDSLNQYFRAFMIKLSSMESQLEELEPSDELTFAIVIECRPGFIPSASQPDPGEPTPWVPASKSYTPSGGSGKASNPSTAPTLTQPKAQLHAVKSVETGVINMSILVQETEDKFTRQQVDEVENTTETAVTSEGTSLGDRIPWEAKGKGKAG